jgi:seryl-tRNA synthetase
MLEIKFVRKNLDLVRDMTVKRGISLDWDIFKVNDKLLRNSTHRLEELRRERNVVSNKIALLKKEGNCAKDLIAKMTGVSSEIKTLEKKVTEVRKCLMEMMMTVPNLIHTSVPVGYDKNSNLVLRIEGKVPDINFDPLPHWTIGENLRLFDLNRASKIAGARFPLLTGIGARMERALINFMIDIHVAEHGYYEILPPCIVNRRALTGTGQLPKFEQDLFKIEGHESFLTPTAEVQVTNMHQNEILDESKFPISYVAYSPCFRSEAGSYGRDVRGLVRQHQFNKVELVKFSLPEDSDRDLEILLNNAETILKRLELHYRVVTLCSGDLGFSASKTYDIEVWMPHQREYKEISSCSNCSDFQTRRANIRIKQRRGTRLAHTLNGSGLAVGRTMAAIIENYQEPDGSLVIPNKLRPYMGGLIKITIPT